MEKENLQENINKNICVCGKQYNSRNGLWKHKKTCITNKPSEKELLMMLIKEQSNLKKLIQEMCQKLK